jgi:hypothetical protein
MVEEMDDETVKRRFWSMGRWQAGNVKAARVKRLGVREAPTPDLSIKRGLRLPTPDSRHSPHSLTHARAHQCSRRRHSTHSAFKNGRCGRIFAHNGLHVSTHLSKVFHGDISQQLRAMPPISTSGLVHHLHRDSLTNTCPP